MRVARVAVTAGLLVLGAGAVGAMRAATRLDRLHVRTEAAWAALDAALCRRARAVREAQGCAGPDLALRAGTAVREEVENELGRVLAVLDRRGLEPDCAGRLADAEQRVMIARRVYNDAVRDTLALRSRPMVRWLRLAGTAVAPCYFEIAEPALPSAELEFDGAGA
ncbi:MAG: NUDIX hydrolase [Pseudonocardiaceae bacterium]